MSNDKQAQVQQYQNTDWDRVNRQISAMTAEEQFARVDAMLSGVPVPPGAQRNQPYEIDYIAQQTGTENFDEIAERITLESDRRIKKSIKKNGDYDYYLWFRTPFTKFRGFWGTLLVTYWLPAMLMVMFLGPVWYINGSHDEMHLFSADPLKNAFAQALGGLAFLFIVINVIVLYWVAQFNIGVRRYFWLARMTGGRTANGVYAHQLMLLAAWVFVFAVCLGAFFVIGESKTGEAFNMAYQFISTPDRWAEVVDAVMIAGGLWLDLFSESGRWAWTFLLLPGLVLLGFSCIGAGPSLVALVFLKRELVNNFSRNVGFPAIASVIDKLESRGEFIGGVRQQGMLRAKLAWQAEKMVGILHGLATGTHVLILVIVGAFALLRAFFS